MRLFKQSDNNNLIQTTMKKQLLIFVMMRTTVNSLAVEVKINGLWYELISKTNFLFNHLVQLDWIHTHVPNCDNLN